LDQVVKETIASLQTIAKKRRIRLVEQPSSQLPPVAADKGMITQAVRNLISNAIKYSPERTTVTVSTALEAEAVRLCVEDRGYGIPAESKDRVWEKFYRVVRDDQDKDEESTGLGLSFVREVVEQHGGAVDLESEVGRGSKFSFTLPRL
jgi:two-component system sensor histidine kinase VicK